jgi:hypothetical protein
MIKNTLVRALVGLAGSAALVVGIAPAASAALPKCGTGYGFVRNGTYGYYPISLAGSRSCVMSSGQRDDFGSGDEPVLILQKALRYCYGYSIALDGVFGSGTRSALVATQKRVKVTADGVFGPATSKAMNWPAFSGSSFVRCYDV